MKNYIVVILLSSAALAATVYLGTRSPHATEPHTDSNNLLPEAKALYNVISKVANN